MNEKTFDCKDNDQLFGGAKPKAAPWRAGPVRCDYSRAGKGELTVKLGKARELLEEWERDCIRQNNLAFKARLELLGESISAIQEIEGRMKAALKGGKENGNHK